MSIHFLWECLFALGVIGAYSGARYVYGTRIYYTDTHYVTLRELMLPLLLVWVHITSMLVLRRSMIPYILLLLSVVGALSAYTVIGRKSSISPYLFLHRMSSLLFLFLCGCIGILMVARFFI